MTPREGRRQPSITSTESFLARAQRSEERRVWLWLGALVGMLLVTLARRAAHGVVMSSDLAFYPTVAVLAAGIAFQAVLLVALRRANRETRLLPEMIWRVSVA